MGTSILVVEDDPRLGSLLVELLTLHGYDATCAVRGDEALERILEESPQLVILDIRLPGMDGLEVCRNARARGYQGLVLMLTARREEIDELTGFEVGADDYLAKPASPPRLMARVRALLRRQTRDQPQGRQPIRSGGLVIDPQQRSATLDGREIELSSSEFDLLNLLAENLGRALTRNEIYLSLYGHDYDGIDRSVDVRISRLRRSLGDDPRNPTWIKTVHGTGYMLARRS